jgi:hypothetical protein
MSLTLADTVMAAVHENGVNDFLAAFFNARRRHLVYGTPAFVPVTTVSATSISAMTFPGVPGGIDILVVFSPPTVDFEPLPVNGRVTRKGNGPSWSHSAPRSNSLPPACRL